MTELHKPMLGMNRQVRRALHSLLAALCNAAAIAGSHATFAILHRNFANPTLNLASKQDD